MNLRTLTLNNYHSEQSRINGLWETGGEVCMAEIGYKLSSEEHPPNDLVAQAMRAEECGFGFAMISDHFHPRGLRSSGADRLQAVADLGTERPAPV